MTDYKIEIACDIPCELGEGPTYDPATDTAFWFDILGRKLFEMDVESRETSVHDLPFMASATGIIDRETQLILAEDGLYIRDRSSGELILERPFEAGNEITRSNDARVHPSGSFWISSMGKQGEEKAGAIYLFREGEIFRLFDEITIPNAICFSPMGDRAYFCDTLDQRIMTVSVDPGTGLPTGKPEVFYDHSGGEGGIDGAINDANGHLWNTRWGASLLDEYDAEGNRIQSIKLPVTQPSCPAFFGKNADQILVTSAYEDMDDAMRSANPSEGCTLIVDAGAAGRHEPYVVL